MIRNRLHIFVMVGGTFVIAFRANNGTYGVKLGFIQDGM